MFNKNVKSNTMGNPKMATKITKMIAPKVGKFAMAVKNAKGKAKMPMGKGKTKGVGTKGASGQMI